MFIISPVCNENFTMLTFLVGRGWEPFYCGTRIRWSNQVKLLWSPPVSQFNSFHPLDCCRRLYYCTEKCKKDWGTSVKMKIIKSNLHLPTQDVNISADQHNSFHFFPSQVALCHQGRYQELTLLPGLFIGQILYINVFGMVIVRSSRRS